MNRKQFLLTTAGAGITVATSAAPGQAQKPKQGLAVSILVSERTVSSGNSEGEIIPVIRLGPFSHHISVVLQNTSHKPMALWDEDCSWGFDNLHLEISAIDGNPLDKPIIVARGGVGWGGNAAKSSLLPAGAMIVREIELAGEQDNKGVYRTGTAWLYRNIPSSVGANRQVRLRAVYSVEPSDFAKRGNVWTGTIASPAQDYLLKEASA